MVEKWTLCIEVSCYPNPGKTMITYVLCNIATNKVLQRKRNVPRRTTNDSENYYKTDVVFFLHQTLHYLHH